MEFPKVHEINEGKRNEAAQRQNILAKPTGSMGRLEDLSIDIAGMTGEIAPELKNRAVFLMAADHGRVEETDFTLGKVNKFVFGLGVQGLFGEGRNRKLNVDVKYNRFHWTEGTEDIIGRGGIIDLHADYTLYTDAKDISYDLELGAGADVTSISARRIAGLEGHFSSFSVLPYVFAGKNIQVTKESTLLARVSLGSNYSAKPGYELEGDSIYKKMYKDEADYLGRFFYRNAADVEYTFRMNTMLFTYARLSLVHQMPMTIKGGRILATLAVGVLF